MFGKSHFFRKYFEKNNKKNNFLVKYDLYFFISVIDPGHIFWPTAIKIGMSTPLGDLKKVFFRFLEKVNFFIRKFRKKQEFK